MPPAAPEQDRAAYLADAEVRLAAGDVETAERMAVHLCAEAPSLRAAFVLHANCAAARADWAAALQRWDDYLQKFPARAAASIGRARALLGLGRLEEALRTTRDLLREVPDHRPAQALLARLLIELDRKADAADELRHGVFAQAAPGPRLDRLRLLNWLGDMPSARAAFAVCLEQATRIHDLSALFDNIPALFEAYDRTLLWLLLRERLAAHEMADDPRHVCLALRIDVALRDYDGFLARLAAAPELDAPWDRRCARLAEILRAAHFPDPQAAKIFCIGLSKTGTTSVAAALEQLGLLTAHYRNPFSNAILAEADVPLLDALADTPVCAHFETLYHTYPHARFIWTQRPLADWLQSLSRQYTHWHGTPDFPALREHSQTRNEIRHGVEYALLHANLYFNHPDARTAAQAYAQRVELFFADKPREKLLLFNLFEGDGWRELCGFLGREIPQTTFPWENRNVGRTGIHVGEM